MSNWLPPSLGALLYFVLWGFFPNLFKGTFDRQASGRIGLHGGRNKVARHGY